MYLVKVYCKPNPIETWCADAAEARQVQLEYYEKFRSPIRVYRETPDGPVSVVFKDI